jgi:hypothetical protein
MTESRPKNIEAQPLTGEAALNTVFCVHVCMCTCACKVTQFFFGSEYSRLKFLTGAVDLNTKLRKILNEENLTLRLLT